MHLLANSALLLTLVHCLLTLVHCAFLKYTQKGMANVPFHTLHPLCGTIFLKLFETQNLLFLSNPPKKLICFSFITEQLVCVCVYVSVCVCVYVIYIT